ncbi:uncharacterized protein LOC121781708 [Salvia splendens]|uniref:uncharacterized protein LOC121781708 n=1 Tax=Salvia splendens TaxID=180675 RepID=UPI001C27B8B8|nr:uncharacterized protein LOC121781708 [Salvia splendens]
MAKTVILVSSDGEWFEIAESVAAQSTVIGNNHGGDELVSGVPVKVLLEYLMAANYLDIKGLIDLVSQKIADSIEACKPEAEAREYDEFTSEGVVVYPDLFSSSI